VNASVLPSNGSVPPLRASRRRYWWLLVIFLLGVLVGWLLAPRCKSCGESTSSAAAGGADKLQGDSDGGKFGPGPRNDAKGGAPTAAGSGTPSPGYDAVGGKLKDADSPSPRAEQKLGGDVAAGPDSVGVPDPAGGHILKASDFRYDKTELPRYAQSVSTTGSTLSHDIGSAAYHSTAVIISSSRFEDVVDWYKAQLPSGWSAQVVGDVGALAQQVSIGNIMNTLTAATQNKGAAPGNALPTTASTRAPSANALRVAMFSPPPHSAGNPSIMIQQGAEHTIEITMSRDGTDP
jgi:hypothetical protein